MAFLLVCAITGCGYPQASPTNFRLISSLRTALSARNAEWLDKNVELIEARRAAGEMADAEYQAFLDIIAEARSGNWESAERATVKYQQAQRPTQEQIDRLPKVKPREGSTS